MTSREFCYWLQGLFELSETKALDAKQTELVRCHLAMVFKHEIDPSYGTPEHQAELGKLHEAVEKLEKHAASPHARPDVRMRC
jgi:hypothetical protein